MLTETVFAWPGLGAYLTSSLLNADMNAVLGGTLVVGAVFIGLNLLSDLLYRLLDPRAGHERRPPPRLARLAAGRRRPLRPSRPARPGLSRPGSPSARNPLALVGPRHRPPAGPGRGPRPAARTAVARSPRTSAPAAPAALRRALARHRRARPRHLFPHRLGRAAHADHRRPGGGHRRPGRACWSAPSRAMPAAGSTPC